MAALAKQVASQTGVALNLVAASAGGDTVPCEQGTVLIVQNTSGASVDVTIATPGTSSGLAIADEVVAVAAAAIEVIGPFGEDFVDAVDGRAHVTYSTAVGVNVGCLHTA